MPEKNFAGERPLFPVFYDLLHGNQEDLPAFLEMAHEMGPRILELGSGTGRISIPLAREGYQVTGIEKSPEMAAYCQDKVEKEKREVQQKINIIEKDIKEMKAKRKFDLILAPNNFINYFINVKELRTLFKKVKEMLKDEGYFVIDNSVPDLSAMVANNDQEKSFEFNLPASDKIIIDRFHPQYDFVKQLEYDQIILEEYEEEELIRREKKEETLTFYFPRELRILIQEEFNIVEERGSLLEKAPITKESREMVFICEK